MAQDTAAQGKAAASGEEGSAAAGKEEAASWALAGGSKGEEEEQEVAKRSCRGKSVPTGKQPSRSSCHEAAQEPIQQHR